MDLELLIPVPVRHRRHGISVGGLRGSSRTYTPPGCERKTYAPRRVCAHPGCDTELSVYNPTDYCSLHAPPVPKWVSGACSECGRPITYKSKSGLCARCVRRAKPEARPRTSLRKDRPDAIQRAQAKIKARLAS